MRKQDGTTGGYTKLILTKRVASWQEKVSSVQLLVSQKLPRGTVEDIRAGFCDNVDDSASDSSELPVEANTICVHSDTPGSVAIARAVNHGLKAAGVILQCLS